MNIKKRILRFFLYQLVVIIGLIMLDLYVLRGFYSSKVIIQNNIYGLCDDENHSFELKIEEKANKQYLFTFKNNLLNPAYFLNYRNEEKFQKVSDSLFLLHLNKNLFPAFGLNYSFGFDCGTGLGFSSINPLEHFEIEKTYDEIIDECSSVGLLNNTEFFTKLKLADLNNIEIDSVLTSESKSILSTDSLQVEYHIYMYSFVSKNTIKVLSNKINLGLKDLLMKYNERN